MPGLHGFPFRPGDNFKNYLTMMGDVMQRTAGLRRPGAAALDLAYVAAGYTDGFETGLNIWDVAAGSLLVTGPVAWSATSRANPTFMEQKGMPGRQPRIYGQLVQILGKYSNLPVPATRPRCARPPRNLGKGR